MSYAEQLRDELVRAAVRQRRLRRRNRTVGLVAAVLVLLAGLAAVIAGAVIGSDEDTAEATTVDVDKTPTGTKVTIIDPTRPDEVIAELRSAGVTVERIERKTGPSKVGTVVSLVVPDDANQLVGNALEVQLDGAARVQVGVGVATPEGGDYEIGTDAFANGEPLWCKSWPGQPTEEFADVVRSDDVAVKVVDAQSGPIDDLPSGKVVVSATAIAANRVLVTVDDRTPAAAPAGCGHDR